MLYNSSVIEMQVEVSLTRAKKKEERGPGGVYLLAHFRVCLGGAARRGVKRRLMLLAHCTARAYCTLVRRGGLVRGPQAFLSLSTRRST